MQCAQFFSILSFFFHTDCQHGNWFAYCHHHCNSVGNVIGLMLEGVDGISNVSIVVYQHLVCPKNKHGPGCELDCVCTEREACHYVRGCHIGKKFFFASWSVILGYSSLSDKAGRPKLTIKFMIRLHHRFIFVFVRNFILSTQQCISLLWVVDSDVNFKSRCVLATTVHITVTVLEMWYVIVMMVIVVKLNVIQDLIINTTDHLGVREWWKVWTLQIG